MEVQLSASASPERGTSKARSLRWHSCGCFSSSLFNDIFELLGGSRALFGEHWKSPGSRGFSIIATFSIPIVLRYSSENGSQAQSSSFRLYQALLCSAFENFCTNSLKSVRFEEGAMMRSHKSLELPLLVSFQRLKWYPSHHCFEL
jgi:hypothetical protein